MRFRIGRRGIFKLAGAAAVASTPIGAMPAHSAFAATANPVLEASQKVNFWMRFDNSFNAFGKATLAVTVGNAGVEDATQPVRVIVTTPFYANFDDTARPAEFTRYIVRNAAPYVPEVMECTIAANRLKAGKETSFSIRLSLLSNGPRIFDMINGVVLAGGDTETTLINNESIATIGTDVLPVPTLPAGKNPVNYYFQFTQARLVTNAVRQLKIDVGNAGTKAPTSQGLFTFQSPYRTKIDRNNVAFQLLNPTYHHNETDVRIPDLVTIPVSRLMLQPDPNLLNVLSSFNIPLRASDRAHSARGGKGFLAAQGNDFDTQPSVAMSRISIIQPHDV